MLYTNVWLEVDILANTLEDQSETKLRPQKSSFSSIGSTGKKTLYLSKRASKNTQRISAKTLAIRFMACLVLFARGNA